MPEFKRAYPEAKLLGVEGTLRRSVDKTLKFDGSKVPSLLSYPNLDYCIVWGKDPPGTKYGFERDVCLIIDVMLAEV